jgi:SAM-dependent methyltransferase
MGALRDPVPWLAAVARTGRLRVASRLVRSCQRAVARQNAHGVDLAPGTLAYRCNVCGARCLSPVADLQRETASCWQCRSTVRMRAIISLVSTTLLGTSLTLPEMPVRKHLTGIGLSDWEMYARPLAEKFSYQNTYLDREPRLDVTKIPPEREQTLDFVISSDVFEHVAPPVGRAFEGAFRLLKPGGYLLLTVPYSLDPSGATVEHFPDLYDFHLEKTPAGNYMLVNNRRDGATETFHDLVFHGGEGLTLEMRVFSRDSLLRELEQAGFQAARICAEPDFAHGVYWDCGWSLPVLARKPA